MRRARYLVAPVVALLAMACSDGGDDQEQRQTPAATLSQQVDLASYDFTKLVYWDALTFFGGEVAPPAFTRVLDAMAASGDPRYEPYLFELALYPTPYRDHATGLLLGDPDATTGDLFEYLTEQGPLSPDDESEEFVRFKSRLMDTVVPGFGDFLDPEEERMISAREVLWGGVAIDGIPPLEEPNFTTPEEASSWILPDDLVIGVEINGDARAYPRRIIDWHEMVNDTVGGVPVSLAYCTLCGSAILYDGRLDGEVLRFGTSGMLYRSNKLMYDRETRSLWEQYTGEPVWGELVGQGLQLEVLPAVHTTWVEWLAEHPETRVLDIETGFRRDYGSGVAYADYWATEELLFPAPNLNGPPGSQGLRLHGAHR